MIFSHHVCNSGSMKFAAALSHTLAALWLTSASASLPAAPRAAPSLRVPASHAPKAPASPSRNAATPPTRPPSSSSSSSSLSSSSSPHRLVAVEVAEAQALAGRAFAASRARAVAAPLCLAAAAAGLVASAMPAQAAAAVRSAAAPMWDADGFRWGKQVTPRH